MSDGTHLEPGDTFTVFNYRWIWTNGDGIQRPHWRSDDDIKIRIAPPSGGYTAWMVYLPGTEPGQELTISIEDEATAFRYGASVRRARAN